MCVTSFCCIHLIAKPVFCLRCYVFLLHAALAFYTQALFQLQANFLLLANICSLLVIATKYAYSFCNPLLQILTLFCRCDKFSKNFIFQKSHALCTLSRFRIVVGPCKNMLSLRRNICLQIFFVALCPTFAE